MNFVQSSTEKKYKNKSSLKVIICVSVAIICAVIARILGKLDYAPITFGLIRSIIYIALYISWGISIRKRVVQMQVRCYLTAIAVLMIFWFMLRTIKYYFVIDIDVARYLWYLYYFPMLFIPLLAVYVSISLGMPEHFKLPHWLLWFYIPTLLCFLLVLTNDFHQLVFTFPVGNVFSDANYDYNFGYYIVFIWNVICALTASVIMVIKTQKNSKEKYLPFIVLAVSIIYALIYSTGVQWIQLIAGDITAAQCLMFAGIFESCIYCGLIRVNTGYVTLFNSSTLGAQITDVDYTVRYTSANAQRYTKEIMCEVQNCTVNSDKNTLLKSHKIDGGYVLWQEDITEIVELLEKLEKNKDTISRSNTIEKENYEIELKINSAREKNRLYVLLQQQTAEQIEFINEFLALYDKEIDEEKKHLLLVKIAVVGAYIKRRGNLMFIMEGSKTIDISELSRCFEESFSNMKLLDIECAFDCPQEGLMLGQDAVRVYDFMEKVTEYSMDNLHAVWLKLRNTADSFIFYLEVVCDKSLAVFEKDVDHCIFEDEAWCFTIHIDKAGDK